MEGMFSYCSNLTSLDVSNFNTANVSNMSSMFDNCSSLTSLDLSNFQTNNITDALSTVSLFYNCSRLKSLNLSATLATNMDSNACSGVGTTESPCVLIYPEDCSIEKEETGDGWFRWSNGYFTEAPAYLMGDVNSDNKVTIADVTALVNIILGKDTAGLYNRDAADVNGDHQITIADVTALVNVILGK
jgi:surface protein